MALVAARSFRNHLVAYVTVREIFVPPRLYIKIVIIILITTIIMRIGLIENNVRFTHYIIPPTPSLKMSRIVVVRGHGPLFCILLRIKV